MPRRSHLVLAAFLAAGSLAHAQSAAPAAPASVEPAPAAADQTPARSVLWPDFQVGQHVVLEMTYLDTSKCAKPILATVDIDVLDKSDDVFTIRWKPSNPRIPSDCPNPTFAPFACVWNATAGPTLEILIQEDVGIIGLKNWEGARDQAVADAQRALIGVQDKGGVITAERAQQVVMPMRDAILSTKDAVEASLLRNVRAYFDGAYHELQPGNSLTMEFESPWPFGDRAEGLYLPMTRTTSLNIIATEPAPVYEFLIDIRPDPKRFKELLASLAETLPRSIQSDEMLKRAQAAVENKVRWTLDTAKGWPTRASSTTRVQHGDNVITQTAAFALVEGPTKEGDAKAPPSKDPK